MLKDPMFLSFLYFIFIWFIFYILYKIIYKILIVKKYKRIPINNNYKFYKIINPNPTEIYKDKTILIKFCYLKILNIPIYTYLYETFCKDSFGDIYIQKKKFNSINNAQQYVNNLYNKSKKYKEIIIKLKTNN